MADFWLLATVAVTILSSVYFYLKRSFRYWEARGIPYVKPHLLFGNIREVFLRKVSDPENLRRVYNEFSSRRYFGFFRFQKPELIVRDPELIKLILVKDFSYFHDRREDFKLNKNDLFSNSIFNMTGKQWKTLRTKLSPTFTSGRMKEMFLLMKECADSLDVIIRRNLKEGANFDVQDLMARYSTDVISSCAFGLRINSLQNPDIEFRKISKTIFQDSFQNRIFFMLMATFPKLINKLGLGLISKSTQKYFIDITESTVKYRDENNVKRNDFLNLLMALRNNSQQPNNDENDKEQFKSESDKIEMTLPLMTAQCVLFLLAGFEVTSAALGFCLAELGVHQDIQEKVRQEIDRMLEENGNEPTYDALNAMGYTHKVVLETLRKYTPTNALFRTCTTSYHVPDTDFVIEKGTSVIIPIYAIHHDPQYYPKPNEFNPDNFSDENKTSRPPFVYLPFGDGPRVCIGERFALMQIKLGLITMIKKYKFSASPKMIVPIEIDPKATIIKIKGGIWLKFVER